MAIAAGTAQVAAVRALSATSAWSAGWNIARASDPQAWDSARAHARSIGRDAAMVLGWRAAWAAATSEKQRDAWAAADAAANLAMRAPTNELIDALVDHVCALVDRRAEPAPAAENMKQAETANVVG
jgi:hypothetical protein